MFNQPTRRGFTAKPRVLIKLPGEIMADVSIKDKQDNTYADVKNDGTNNALVVVMNTIPNIDIGDISKGTQTNDIKITLDGEDVAVTGTFWQTTQPVSGTFWQTTQPVSATNLDIRDLTSASDNVEVLQDTAADLNMTEVNSGTIKTHLSEIEGAVETIETAIKAEDAPHSSGDKGIMALAVRNDGNTSLGGSDGDYVPLQTDEHGSLWVDIEPSLVDSGNSTTSTLNSGVAFTGTGINLLDYQAITITVFASHDSATDGMTFQFSTDNINWDDVYEFTLDVSESATRRFQFPTTAQFFRVVYTNGGTNQTAFRLQTILHHMTPLTSIHRIQDTLTIDRSAQLTKAIIAGQTTAGGGAMVNVKVNPSGTLETNASQDTAADLNMTEVNSGAIKTAVEKIDDAIDGTEMQVDIVTQPARINTTDNVGAFLATNSIMNGTTALTPKFAVIDDATSGNNTLIAAVSGKKIRVLALFMIAADPVNARFEDGASGSALTGQMNLTSNSGFVLPFNPVGWFETSSNTLLNLELSAAVSVDGSIVYVEV